MQDVNSGLVAFLVVGSFGKRSRKRLTKRPEASERRKSVRARARVVTSPTAVRTPEVLRAACAIVTRSVDLMTSTVSARRRQCGRLRCRRRECRASTASSTPTCRCDASPTQVRLASSHTIILTHARFYIFRFRSEFAQVGLVSNATHLPAAGARVAPAPVTVAPVTRVAQPTRLPTRQQRPLATAAHATAASCWR